MAWKVRAFETTPNPNAVKAVLDRPICERTRSFRRPEEAEGEPLAGALFAIEGVTSVMMLRDFVTVNKRSDASWKPIKRQVRRVLREA